MIRTDDAVLEFGQYVGDMENHEAEWTSLIAALKQAEALAIRSVILKSDSRIVVDSVQKNYTKIRSSSPICQTIGSLKINSTC